MSSLFISYGLNLGTFYWDWTPGVAVREGFGGPKAEDILAGLAGVSE